ncbi:MAG: hypothetical protein GWN71_45560 [Gammaproteobacteria bacterium]|nr:hypothetical protein [Gammaproteobacteria bacterium]
MADEGVRWIVAADGVAEADRPALEERAGTGRIHTAQAGALADMDRLADVLYGRDT